jgi:L-alanine-DL-glutamate epimerase-like enolase superfamily enzyme
MSFGGLRERVCVLLELEAHDGSIGVGESWVNHPFWASEERVATLRNGVIPLLLGHDARRINRLHQELAAALLPLGRQWGAEGPIWQAISAANTALWDLVCRADGQGLAQKLGGRVRDRVRVYASSLGPDDVADHGEEIARRGFSAAKLKVGFGPEIDTENLQAARQVLGADVALMVDANQAWRPASANGLDEAFRSAGVEWVEEPLRGNDLSELRRYRELGGLPVATGENVYGRASFLPYIVADCVEVLQPDISKCGGVNEMLPVMQLAESVGKRVVPHLYGGGVALAATLQLAAAVPAADLVEFDVRANPLGTALLRESLDLKDGHVEIPDGAGLGVTLDTDCLGEYEEFVVEVTASSV